MRRQRRLLAALAAGLAGCGGHRRGGRRRDGVPGPDDLRAGSPSTPTPRSWRLAIDESFSWLAPYYDTANACRPATAGPVEVLDGAADRLDHRDDTVEEWVRRFDYETGGVGSAVLPTPRGVRRGQVRGTTGRPPTTASELQARVVRGLDRVA